MSPRGAVPEPGPGYTKGADDEPLPVTAARVAGIGIFLVNGAPRVVIETSAGVGVILDADDTESIARLATHVASMRRDS